MAAGVNGPMLHALSELFEGAEVIDRSLINAWQDPRVHEAITATLRMRQAKTHICL